MKGIVADIKGNYMVVMAQDGSFVKTRYTGACKVGCEIDLDKSSGKAFGLNLRLAARISSIAAGAALALGLGFGAYCYTVPYSVVDIDINPSVEITANVFDRIIDTKGLNDDGKKLLDSGSLKHAKLDEGVAAILETAVKQGYIKEQNANNTVVLAVSSNDAGKTEELKNQLQTAASSKLASEGVKTELVTEKVSRQEQDKAKELGMTPGKLNLIEKAVDAVPGLKIEDLKDAPVADIMKQIKDNRKTEKQTKQGQNQTKQGQSKADDQGVVTGQDQENRQDVTQQTGQDTVQDNNQGNKHNTGLEKTDNGDSQQQKQQDKTNEDRQGNKQNNKQNDKQENKQNEKQDSKNNSKENRQSGQNGKNIDKNEKPAASGETVKNNDGKGVDNNNGKTGQKNHNDAKKNSHGGGN